MADVGVVVFPGSNCDRDAFHVLDSVLGHSVAYHWYQDPIPSSFQAVVLPGGFSYGDYLRAGALAKFSPAVESLGKLIDRGGLVLGICNGFQILVEAGFLPGAMMKNESLRFQSHDVHLRVETNRSPLLHRSKPGQVLRMPIAHAEGRYTVDADTLKKLKDDGCIALRYCGPQGEIDETFNANGSIDSIAGVTNLKGNVLGLMPHPERCAEACLSSSDGLYVLASMVDQL